MKKIVAAVIVFAGITALSCSKDDTSAKCAVCSFNQNGTNVSESVCEGDNGNAFVQDEDTGIDYDEYIATSEESGYECN